MVVEPAHRSRHKGNFYRTRIDLAVSGAQLVANRENDINHAHEDIYVALRDAFDAMSRQLEDYERGRRGEVKRRESTPSWRDLAPGEAPQEPIP